MPYKVTNPNVSREIAEIVEGLGPIDYKQVELIGALPPERRVLLGMRATAFARAARRGAFKQRFPELSDEEINMKVLASFTPIRGLKL